MYLDSDDPDGETPMLSEIYGKLAVSSEISWIESNSGVSGSELSSLRCCVSREAQKGSEKYFRFLLGMSAHTASLRGTI